MKAQQIITHLAVLALLVALEARATPPADGENMPAMGLLCPAHQLANGEIKLQPDQAKLEADLQDLLALNMSLADRSWVAQFRAAPDGAAAPPQGNPQQKQQAGTPQELEAWRAAKATVDDTENFKNVLAKYGYTPENASQLMPLKGVIAQYAEAAFDIQEAEKTKVPTGHTDDQLKTLIKTAVYGHNGGYDVSKKAELGFPDSENREAACTAQSNSNPVKTIAGMVACLCTVKDNMAPAKAPCGPYGGEDLKWGTTTPPGNALWKKMRSSCPEEPKKRVTAMRIQNALTAAKLAFQAGGSDLYVGKYDGTGCDGSTNTACIKYTNQAQNSVPIFTKAEWLEKLQTVQSELQQRLLAEQSKSQVIRQIETLKQLVKAATKHAEKLTPPTTQHQSDPKLATANDKK
uniref:Variant surface glycoprotein 1427 n=1 Tax=Trypanosoma brucei TaxID=5691 RepID=M4SVD6_9TRYP|nr:variant surface glycoprotein 1427 [Trypanosoma brucei]